MINKYEAIGISVSIFFMAAAIFLLRLENISFLSNADNNLQTASVAVVDDSTHGSLEQTIKSSIDKQGDLQSLIIDDVVIGEGRQAVQGDTVTVHYVGSLPNGQQFDNSERRGEPFTFTLGNGEVIEGWEKGIVGMREGGERILVIPPEMAYGTQSVGPIPPNATLVFSVKLLEIN